jgi:hypothetical protein
MPKVVPAVVVPGHGVTGVVAGAGSVIIGLTPRLLSSVAPNGTVVIPGSTEVAVESGDAVPAGDTFVDDPGAQFVETNPPPSKVVPAVADVPTWVPPMVAGALVLIVVQGTGLNPPGSISVAPSGIPVGPEGVVEAPSIPVGDVIPNAGVVPVVEMLWACAIVQLSKIVAATKACRCMDLTSVVPRSSRTDSQELFQPG